jgi:hypothetical protein
MSYSGKGLYGVVSELKCSGAIAYFVCDTVLRVYMLSCLCKVQG